MFACERRSHATHGTSLSRERLLRRLKLHRLLRPILELFSIMTVALSKLNFLFILPQVILFQRKPHKERSIQSSWNSLLIELNELNKYYYIIGCCWLIFFVKEDNKGVHVSRLNQK